jgi:hypothetical protein
MLREIPHSVCVEAHNNDRYVLAEPAEEFQYSPAIPITMLYQHIHQLGNINVLYQPQDFGFLFLCHNSLIFKFVVLLIYKIYAAKLRFFITEVFNFELLFVLNFIKSNNLKVFASKKKGGYML